MFSFIDRYIDRYTLNGRAITASNGFIAVFLSNTGSYYLAALNGIMCLWLLFLESN